MEKKQSVYNITIVVCTSINNGEQVNVKTENATSAAVHDESFALEVKS